MTLPDPDALYPLQGFTRTVFLRTLLARHPEITNVEVGRFSYYDDGEDPLPFFTRNVRYNMGYSGARLVIGAFCALAQGTVIIMPDASHASTGPSSFPFAIFGGAFADALPITDYPFPPVRDTIIGNDAWIGTEAMILPGVRIGHGAIIGARAVVTRDVPDYAVAVGNPARVVRMRYADAEIARLLRLAWWDWPLERIARAIPFLVRGPVSALEDLAP